MPLPWKRHYPDIPEDVPIDVMPASNGEYIPEEPTADQLAIMRLQNSKVEELRRRFGMSRRDFVRTAAAFSVGVWAVDQVTGRRWGRYAFEPASMPIGPNDACDLENPGAQLANLPGEFILDTQGHCLDSAGKWRVAQPDFEYFLTIWTSPAQGGPPGVDPRTGRIHSFGAGEIDHMENLGRNMFYRESFLNSSADVVLLTALPNLPDDTNITPMKFATETRDIINGLTRSERCLIHAFTQPNRGWVGPGQTPIHQAEDYQWMTDVNRRDDVRGWKLYCGWGDPVPNINGWWFDDELGLSVVNHIRELSKMPGARPPVVCTHKGLAFNGTFDSAHFSPRDMGVIARQFPDITFYTYHSGYDGEYQLPYAGDDAVNSSNRGVDAFIKSLRENGWDATRFVPPGLQHGNTVNIYAELGTAWWGVMRDADQAVHMLGKLIRYVGPRRIVLGTDCIWYGSPQPQFVMLRALHFSEEAKQLYNLPYGLDGDRWDPTRNALSGATYMSHHPNVPGWPTDGRAHPERSIRNGIFGRNAAAAYGVDPDAIRGAISCDEVQRMRDAYLINPGTPAEQMPLRSNLIAGPRTRREFFNFVRTDYPWS
jgi:uncharacterized protein